MSRTVLVLLALLGDFFRQRSCQACLSNTSTTAVGTNSHWTRKRISTGSKCRMLSKTVLQPKFRLMESSIRDIFTFWKLSWGLENGNTSSKNDNICFYSKTWKTIIHSSKIDDLELYTKYPVTFWKTGNHFKQHIMQHKTKRHLYYPEIVRRSFYMRPSRASDSPLVHHTASRFESQGPFGRKMLWNSSFLLWEQHSVGTKDNM